MKALVSNGDMTAASGWRGRQWQLLRRQLHTRHSICVWAANSGVFLFQMSDALLPN
jgi:hypothetical protein